VFVSRRRRHDPLLEWKVRLFSVAAVLVVLGLYFGERWMTGAAIVILLGAMLLRFLPHAGDAAHEEADEDDDVSGESAIS